MSTTVAGVIVGAGLLAQREEKERRKTETFVRSRELRDTGNRQLLFRGLTAPIIVPWWESRTVCERRGIVDYTKLSKRLTDTSSFQRLRDLYMVRWEAPIGEGAYGDVYAATSLATGKKVACKKISKTYTDNVGFQREMLAFLHIRKNGGHPGICSLHENFDEGSDYYLILDFISGGEMFDHLINNGPYSEADAARLMREIASALAFIHGIGCVHGDLKPENLMLSTANASDAIVKIIDFGTAQIVSESGTPLIPASEGNTWAYCPPEVLDHKSKEISGMLIHPSLDMWSLGIILYIMLVGAHPFDLEGGTPDDEVARQVIRSNLQPPPLVDSEYTDHLSPSAIDLIQRLLAYDSNDRLSASEMLEHPWVRGETAREDKLADSDKKLSTFRVFKSGLETDVFEKLFTWSEEGAEEVAKKTSLIERSFRSFDAQQKGYITRKDLKKLTPMKSFKNDSDEDEDGDETLTLSTFSDLLSEHMQNKYFKEGHVVYNEGEEGNEMFFINSGVVEISTKEGFKLRLQQGDFVGEGALLSPDKIRSATVKCITPVHAIEINRQYFDKYLSTCQPNLNLKMREKDKSRALIRTKAILRQQNELKTKDVSRGEALYSAGDQGNQLFIVEEGDVDVMAQGTTVFSVGQGDMVGVSGIIQKRPHVTSAICSSDKCILRVMQAKDFHRMLLDSPTLKASVSMLE